MHGERGACLGRRNQSPRQGCRPAFSLAWLVLALWMPPAFAELRVAEAKASLGTVRGGVPAAHEFCFTNAGPGVVHLLDAQPGCGCLTPRLERRAYQVGETGSVRLVVNTLGQSAGDHTWRLQLRYRIEDGPVRELPLELHVRVITEVTVQPAELTLVAAQGLASEIVLTDLRDRPLTLAAVRTSSPRLEARAEPACRDALGHWMWRIRLDVSPAFAEGRHEEALHIYTTDPVYSDLMVPVTVVKRSNQRLAALPGQVILHGVPGLALPAQLVRVRDRQDEPVVVARVVADDPALVCHWAAGPDHLATVKIQVDATRLGGRRLDSAIHIETISPVRETLTLPVTCTIE
jgi:hypothetical protein